MPPSTHYLNLLNLNQADDQSLQVDYTNEDIAKELELFTNTNFLDTEPFYHQNYDPSAFDQHMLGHNTTQLNLGPSDKSKQRSSSTVPRNQRPQFQSVNSIPSVPFQNGEFYEQRDPSYDTSLGKRSADAAGFDYSATSSVQPEDEEEKKGKTLDEEDKRRRNTAASARFRIKKKQREQALLESAKQMTDKNTALENRVKELEMENKWLRSLLKPVNMEQSKNVLASL